MHVERVNHLHMPALLLRSVTLEIKKGLISNGANKIFTFHMQIASKHTSRVEIERERYKPNFDC